MTNELKEVINKIDVAFKEYFKDDEEVKTIFAVGSMVNANYVDRQDNDYDIRVISSHVSREQILNFESFLQELSIKLSNENLSVGYSCLVGPVNHKVSLDKKNILIHAMIHESSQMDDFIPITHKYQYGTCYKIITGEDSLARFKNIRYNLDEMLNVHEGLIYCIDMLEKKEYRYLSWDIDENDCKFNYHVKSMPEDTIFENCFYSFNKFINNLINYCKWNNYDIPNDKMCFAIRLIGQENIDNDILFLLHGLFTKNEIILEKVFKNPLQATIDLLKLLEINVKNIGNIFKNEDIKTKKLIKN